jgi:hypothetical protein
LVHGFFFMFFLLSFGFLLGHPFDIFFNFNLISQVVDSPSYPELTQVFSLTFYFLCFFFIFNIKLLKLKFYNFIFIFFTGFFIFISQVVFLFNLIWILLYYHHLNFFFFSIGKCLASLWCRLCSACTYLVTILKYVPSTTWLPLFFLQRVGLTSMHGFPDEDYEALACADKVHKIVPHQSLGNSSSVCNKNQVAHEKITDNWCVLIQPGIQKICYTILDLTILSMKVFISIYISSLSVRMLQLDSWTKTVRWKNSHQ